MPQVRGTELTVAVWATAAPSYMWGYPPWRLSYISWCLPWLSTWCRLELHERDLISPDKSQRGFVLTGRWCLCPGQRRSHQVGGRTGQSNANRLPRWTGTGRSKRQPRPGGRAGYTGTASETGISSGKEKGMLRNKKMDGASLLIPTKVYQYLQTREPRWRWSERRAATSGPGSCVQWRPEPAWWRRSLVRGSAAALRNGHRWGKTKKVV